MIETPKVGDLLSVIVLAISVNLGFRFFAPNGLPSSAEVSAERVTIKD